MKTHIIIAAILVATVPLTDALVDWNPGKPAEGFTQEEAAAHAALVVRAIAEAERHHKAGEAKAVLFKPRNEQERAEKIAEVFNAGRE